MSFDTGLADRLRQEGLAVKEVDGWKTRSNGGESFNPIVFVRHHTAGPRREDASTPVPSLNLCVNGRPDLGGPLCNLYLGFDGIVYVVAAGPANHAGIPDGGSYRGATGNSSSWGLEIEHPGTVQLDAERHEISARIAAATIRGTVDASQVCDHREWAPSRKIDLATGPTAAQFRSRVAFYLKNGGDEMGYPPWLWSWADWYLNTSRDPEERPKGAPEKIPPWAWDAVESIRPIATRHGMTEGERDWIDWLDAGKAGERPDVPATIPERWWVDNEYVAGKSE